MNEGHKYTICYAVSHLVKSAACPTPAAPLSLSHSVVRKLQQFIGESSGEFSTIQHNSKADACWHSFMQIEMNNVNQIKRGKFLKRNTHTHI